MNRRGKVRPEEILSRFDTEMRRNPPAAGGARIERAGSVVRAIFPDGGCVVYSELAAAEVDAAIAGEVVHFRSLGIPVEWKVHGHDQPPGLGQMLETAGFVADPPETLSALDLGAPANPHPAPPGVEVRRVEDERGVEDMVRVSVQAFARPKEEFEAQYRRLVHDPDVALFLAYLDGQPVSAGRLEMAPERAFAGLYGGGTVPEFRHRGIYRSLVEARASFARERGYRFLTVDALETSRPILELLGFRALTSIVGWIWTPPGSGEAPRSMALGTGSPT
jgi:GNAT superfamily N-acetyltransferase